jgi:hypothetical protein
MKKFEKFIKAFILLTAVQLVSTVVFADEPCNGIADGQQKKATGTKAGNGDGKPEGNTSIVVEPKQDPKK